MTKKNLGEGLVELAPSINGNKIMEIHSQSKYSEVVCKEEQEKNFKEVEA